MRYLHAGGLLLVVLASLGTIRPELSLIDAVKQGNTAAVRALIEQRVDVNVREPDGTTALHWAVHRDDAGLADLLIGARADVKAVNRYGVAPLALACTNGNPAIIESLLKAGVDPNTALPEGETALLTAARTGRVDAVKVLLAYGADVTAKERWRGQDALMWAAAEGHVATAQQLIAHGADVNSRSTEGYTPLVFATRQGHVDLVKVLLTAGANVDDSTSARAGASALIIAIYNAHWDLAGLLLEQGADPNISASGYTPLHLALQIRNPDVDRNPDPEQFSDPVKSNTLDSLDIIKALLVYGANPNAQITKGFIGLGAPPDMPLIGATPFFLAAKGADLPVMRLLMASGVENPLLPTKASTTPLMAAAGVGYQQGRSSGSEGEALEAVKLTVELGADVNAANAGGFTALHGAAIRGANSVVQFLFDRGARLDAKDRAGRTALTIAEEGAGDSQQRRQLHTAALLRSLAAGSR